MIYGISFYMKLKVNSPSGSSDQLRWAILNFQSIDIKLKNER